MTAFHAAAELTWGLIISSLRRIPQEAAALKAGRWQSSAGIDMQGTTLGIFGYGRIGGLMARYAKAFEMKPIAWGRKGSIDRARADGVEIAASREALFEQSDVLAVTVRLYPETKGLVTRADLARMKPTSLFVNTSRAALVEPGALLEALQKGRPGMAALDVFDNEPVFGASDPLVTMDNVVCSPHLGYVTRSNLESYFTYCFEQIEAWLAGKPKNMVNPEVLQAALAQDEFVLGIPAAGLKFRDALECIQGLFVALCAHLLPQCRIDRVGFRTTFLMRRWPDARDRQFHAAARRRYALNPGDDLAVD